MADVTYSNTKAQIWNAYKVLLKEKKQVEKDLATARKARPKPVAARPVVAAPKPAATDEQPTDIASVIAGLGGLQDGFRSAVGELEGDLVREAARLAELRLAADQLSERLVSQHGIEVDEQTLEALVMQAVTAADEADEAHAAQVAAHQTEMAERKAAWADEMSRQRAAVAERNADRAKIVAREEAEYSYRLARTRDLDADAETQRVNAAEKTLAAFETETRQAWADRDSALEARETELRELEEKAEAFPAEFMATVDKAKAQGLSMARKDAETKARMAAQLVATKKGLGAERIEALEATIATQKDRIERLGGQLEAALKQAQQLAVKALEGAANANSYAAVREIAMEQARNTKNGK